MKTSLKIKIIHLVESILNYHQPVIIPFEKVEHNILRLTVNYQITCDQIAFNDNEIVLKSIAEMFVSDLVKRDLIKVSKVDDNSDKNFITFESNLFILTSSKQYHYANSTNQTSR